MTATPLAAEVERRLHESAELHISVEEDEGRLVLTGIIGPILFTTLVVVQGIAKGDRGELAVQAMTEVGVDEIVPWAAARSVARWQGPRPHERWVATAREAAKQSRRAWQPAVAPMTSTAEVTARLAEAGTALVLHGSAAAARLSTVELSAGTGDIVLAVGPEGGITDDELAAFAGAGAVPVRLGRTVLRTSTAGVAALSVLSVRLARW